MTLLIHVTYRHRYDAIDSIESAVGRSVEMAQDEENSQDINADITSTQMMTTHMLH